jgi:hypothetical protein
VLLLRKGGENMSMCSEFLTYHTNFETFGSAMLTLVRVSTFDSWAPILRDLTVQPPLCSRQARNCGQPMAVNGVYFVSFIVIVCFLLLNLIVGCIIQNFEILQTEEHWAFNPEQISMLLRMWSHVSDVQGTVSHNQLVKMLRSVHPPLGMGPEATNSAIVKAVEDMGIVSVFQQRCTPTELQL